MTAAMQDRQISVYEQLDRQRILPGSNIRAHEFLFRWHDIPCCACGELVAVTGKAKSGKTYLNSILMAAALRLQTESLLGLQRMRPDPLRVLWIDTEQSEDSTLEILRDRIGGMTGAVPDDEQLFVYNLRQVNWQERQPLIEAAILRHMPDLVIFDGIRDIVGDINDYQEAQNVICRLLSIASFSHACIVCVLHQNKAVEDKTLRGALGTELQNKSFETYECAKSIDSHIFTITQIATRKYDMRFKLQFTISSEGLPVPCSNVADTAPSVSLPVNKERFNPDYIGPDGKIDKAKLFASLLNDHCLTWNELRAQIMHVANVRSPHFAEKLITEAKEAGMLDTIIDKDALRKYTWRSKTTLFDEAP